MPVVCLLVLAAIAAAPLSQSQGSRAAPVARAAGEPREIAALSVRDDRGTALPASAGRRDLGASQPRLARRHAGDPPRLASGYRSAALDLRWRAPDGEDAAATLRSAPARPGAAIELAALADPRCRADRRSLTGPCSR